MISSNPDRAELQEVSNKPNSNRKILPQLIRQAAEGITVLAISSYVIGSIVVTSCLLSYGYAGISLFKVKYAAAGFLLLLISCLIAFSLYPLLGARQEKGKPNFSPQETRHKAILGAQGSAILFLYLLFNMMTDPDIRIDNEDAWWPSWLGPSWVGIVILVVLIVEIIIEVSPWQRKLPLWLRKYPGLSYLVLCLAMFLASYKIVAVLSVGILWCAVWLSMSFILHDTPLQTRVQDWPESVLSDLSRAVIFALIAIVWFATSVYGHIKPQFGGGSPSRVRVALSVGKDEQLKRLGFRPSAQTLLSDAQLIDSSETGYLLLVKQSHGDKGVLIELRRDIVDMMMYIPTSP